MRHGQGCARWLWGRRDASARVNVGENAALAQAAGTGASSHLAICRAMHGASTPALTERDLGPSPARSPLPAWSHTCGPLSPALVITASTPPRAQRGNVSPAPGPGAGASVGLALGVSALALETALPPASEGPSPGRPRAPLPGPRCPHPARRHEGTKSRSPESIFREEAVWTAPCSEWPTFGRRAYS